VPDKPTTEFGKRRPAAIPATAPVKRSGHVALLLMGTFAVGGGAYALMPRETCEPNRPAMASDLPGNAGCRPRGSGSSGGGYIGSRSSFFSSDASSSRSSSGTSSEGSSGSVTRGGFGGFAHAFASHFSGGG
jgi:hypothetical protein